MQTLSSDENSVCLSVCLSVRLSNACIVTKRKKNVPDIYTIRKINQPSFLQKRMVGGGDPFYLKFWVNRPRWGEIVDFEQIIARNASVVRSSEKSSINTNRKSPTRFPTNLRWSSYVAPKSPKGGLENAKRPFYLWNRTSLEESLLQSFFVWKLSAAKL